MLLEVSQAATEFDMDMGVYLSPWDAHSPLYHVEREVDYNAYYLAQLKEILSNSAYGNGGKFAEVWMDGARGEGAQKVNYEFAAYRNELYKEDLALGAAVSGPTLSADFACHHLTDGFETSSWASDADLPIHLELDLGSPKTFDVIELREDLKLGQRIAAFHVQVEVDGVWQEFGMGFTVGHKRLLRGPLVEAQKVRVMITEAQSMPVLTKIALYKTPSLSKQEVVQGLAFAEKSLAVAKGETLHFRIERSESHTPLEAKISVQPGTGVHGVAYQDEIQILQFQAGESKKDLTIPTLYFAADKTLDFYLNLTVDGQLVDQLQVQIS